MSTSTAFTSKHLTDNSGNGAEVNSELHSNSVENSNTEGHSQSLGDTRHALHDTVPASAPETQSSTSQHSETHASAPEIQSPTTQRSKKHASPQYVMVPMNADHSLDLVMQELVEKRSWWKVSSLSFNKF